ncbi:Type 1 glutamine amidotransferase-like domain-containing protein [Campylobacter sp. RM16192]|uniref:Type 1 glutamine amidotransferase-like domain-containing protein n=1 Tax=Campylobacter sp. RM16192 TaxID=1660080 RepID=UPI0014511419|nr:Type 1 glutamine amidotransferase-like domain-containing protein [Campylobacter sp. RM16192]QCD52435.1 peptidase E family protein [Campylobacter sp. RM16192]
MKNIFLCSYFAGVFELFADKFDCEGKSVCFISTAGKFEEVNFYVDEVKECFKNADVKVDELDISVSDKTEILKKFSQNDFIYVCGGNTFYLLSEFKKSGVISELKSLVNSGKIYIGESAGGIITSPDIEYIGLMDENLVELKDLSGLNLVSFYTLPHLGEFPFEEACNNIIAKFGEKIDLKAINNSEAILIRGEEAVILSAKSL